MHLMQKKNKQNEHPTDGGYCLHWYTTHIKPIKSLKHQIPTAVAQWLRRAAVRRNSGLIPDAAVVFLIEPENENACIEISVLVKDPLGV